MSRGFAFDIKPYTRLCSIVVSAGGSLVVTVEERTGLGPPLTASDIPEEEGEFGAILEGSREQIATIGDRVLAITWDATVAYVVLNESFALPMEEYGAGPSNLRAIKAPSSLKPFLDRAMWADSDWPGELHEYAILTQDVIVRVVSHLAPTVQVLSVRA